MSGSLGNVILDDLKYGNHYTTVRVPLVVALMPAPLMRGIILACAAEQLGRPFLVPGDIHLLGLPPSYARIWHYNLASAAGHGTFSLEPRSLAVHEGQLLVAGRAVLPQARNWYELYWSNRDRPQKGRRPKSREEDGS